MNTSQLTILWYAGWSIIAILLIFPTNIDSVYAFILAIIVLAALLIYTLKPHPQVQKFRLLLFVIGPFVALVVGWYGWSSYEWFQERGAASLIQPEQLEIMNLEVKSSDDFRSNFSSDCYSDDCLYLTGTVVNRSSHALTSLKLDFDAINLTVELLVPPGQSRPFKQELSDAEFLLLPVEKGVPLPIKILETRGQVVEKE